MPQGSPFYFEFYGKLQPAFLCRTKSNDFFQFFRQNYSKYDIIFVLSTATLHKGAVAFDDEITRFLLIAHDPLIRPDLLALLQELELLSSYLEAENGTN